MNKIALAVVAAGVCAGLAQPAAAAQVQPLTKYYVSVDGSIAPVSLQGTFAATLTFDHDVQVPGAVLPAGTYLFTQTSPTTMLVTSEDRTKTYTSFDTIQATRLQSSTGAQLRFQRMPDGAPRLIALYPYGGTNGYSLVFKKTHTGAGAPIATSGKK